MVGEEGRTIWERITFITCRSLESRSTKKFKLFYNCCAAFLLFQWDLACESQLLKSVTQFLFMERVLLGSLIYDHFSDR